MTVTITLKAPTVTKLTITKFEFDKTGAQSQFLAAAKAAEDLTGVTKAVWTITDANTGALVKTYEDTTATMTGDWTKDAVHPTTGDATIPYASAGVNANNLKVVLDLYKDAVKVASGEGNFAVYSN
jgi:hypothetical protein